MRRTYTESEPCPICGNSGKGSSATRCHGYVAESGRTAYCAQVESSQQLDSGVYRHDLGRACRFCREEHGEARAPVEKTPRERKRADDWQPHVTYDYVNRHGDLVLQVCRWNNSDGTKRIVQRQPDGEGGWWADTQGIIPDDLLYQLPRVLEAVKAGHPVWFVEGEKDADKVQRHLGIAGAATTTPGGALRCEPAMYLGTLKDANRLTIVQDRDGPGRERARRIYQELHPHLGGQDEYGLPRLRIVEARAGKDASDHLATYPTLDSMIEVEPPEMETTSREGRARIITWEEFVNATTPPAIVNGVVYESSTHVLNGASKEGKSVLAAQLAASVATGARFLNLEVTRQRVLMLSLEMGAGTLWDRLRQIVKDVGLPMPEPDYFQVVASLTGEAQQINLLDPDDVAHLRGLIEQSEAKLVVFDTFYRFIPGADFNDNGQMGKVMGTLNTLASQTSAALLVVHHTRKGDQEGLVSQSGLGAQIIGGAANVVAHLQRSSTADGPRWRLDVASHYSTQDEPIHYRRPDRDGGLGMGCVPCEPREAVGVTDAGQVAALFREHGQPVRDAQGREVPGVYYFSSQAEMARAAKAARLGNLTESSSDGRAKSTVRTLLSEPEVFSVQDTADGRKPLFAAWVGDPGALGAQPLLLISGGQMELPEFRGHLQTVERRSLRCRRVVRPTRRSCGVGWWRWCGRGGARPHSLRSSSRLSSAFVTG